MQISKTLNWFQQQSGGTARANITTTVKDEAGVIVAVTGSDVEITDATTLAALANAEAAVCTLLGATPAAPAATV